MTPPTTLDDCPGKTDAQSPKICHSEGEARGNLLVKLIVVKPWWIGAHLLLPPYPFCVSGDCRGRYRSLAMTVVVGSLLHHGGTVIAVPYKGIQCRMGS